MVSFHSFEPQPEPIELVLPTYITFQAASATKSVYLCAYCNTPEGIVDIIQRTVQRLGGMSVCQPLESGSFSRQLSIGAQLPGLSSSDLWKIRAAIQKSGGIVETVRVSYPIRRPTNSSFERPKACVGCRYYYGKSHGNTQLICAMHPYGSNDDTCLDWANLDA